MSEQQRGVDRRPPLPSGPFLVLGLGRSGTAAASALRRRGERVIGVDSGDPASAQRLRQEGVEVHTGSDGAELVRTVATLVKSPGVPEAAPALTAAQAHGVTVIGELELGWRMIESETIAVTGTNGKTTTVELIGHIHREAGLAVALAGNIGLALSALAGRIGPDVTVVCEASSFQLQDTIAFAPEAAALINLTPDHLDRHASFERYVEAKLEIFARQRQGDAALLPSEQAQLPERVRALGCRATLMRFGAASDAQMRLADGRLLWRQEPLIETAEIALPGAHNLQNAMVAAALCLARGIDPDAVRAGLRSFRGVKHRLEEIARTSAAVFVNDSKATNIASTRVAVQALAAPPGEPPRIQLILGGQGKGQDFAELADELAGACAGVHLIGEDAPQIAEALADSGVPVHACGDLPAAVRSAVAAARRARGAAGWVSAARGGDPAAALRQAPPQVVLLSPGCASFDQFDDFEARGEAFRKIVAAL